MNGAHKGHTIMVSAARLSTVRHQWKLCLTIIWSEDGNGIVSKLTVNRTFRLRQDAEMAGLMFAKKWIDDGKPDLSLGSELDRPAGDTKQTLQVDASTR